MLEKIFGKKDKEPRDERPLEQQVTKPASSPEPTNLEYTDGPADPKNVGHPAPGAAMNRPAAENPAQVDTPLPRTLTTEEGKTEAERRTNVEGA